MENIGIEATNQSLYLILLNEKENKSLNGQIHITLAIHKSELSSLESERLCIDIKWFTSSQLRLLSNQI